jgi:nitrile hydratase
MLKEVAPLDRRARALETVLRRKGLVPDGFIENLKHSMEEEWVPENGAKVIARAWVDPEFRDLLLRDGTAAVSEMGYAGAHGQYVVALENKPDVQNVIVCSLCSCTAWTLLGLPPEWYKSFEYRARVVREPREVLKEMGTELPADVEIRVWDTTAETRYMVLPERPDGTEGWSEEQLAAIVTKDAMIGVTKVPSQR